MPENVPGCGLMLSTSDGEMRIGRPDWCGLSPNSQTDTGSASDGSYNRVVVAIDQQPLAIITLDDPIRPAAARWLEAWQPLPIILLSGDEQSRVAAVARQLGISDARGEQTPAQKLAAITAWQDAGERVVMIGDGLNDAPALRAASVGIGVRGALEAVLESGDIAIARDDPHVMHLLRASSGAHQSRHPPRPHLGRHL